MLYVVYYIFHVIYYKLQDIYYILYVEIEFVLCRTSDFLLTNIPFLIFYAASSPSHPLLNEKALGGGGGVVWRNKNVKRNSYILTKYSFLPI